MFIWIPLFNDHFIVVLSASVYYFICDSRSVAQNRNTLNALKNCVH